MPRLRIKRGTRAQITTAASGNQLLQGELYHVTDEDRIELGTGTGTSVSMAKKSEIPKVTVASSPPASPSVGDIWIDTSGV